jgi:hypothetical protein
VTFRAPKLLLLGCALALTLLPKALPKFQLDNPSPPQAEAAAELRVLALVAFLSRNGFEALGEQRKFGRLVQASSGNCRLRVVEVDSNGATRDKVRLITMQRVYLRWNDIRRSADDPHGFIVFMDAASKQSGRSSASEAGPRGRGFRRLFA